VTVFDPDQFIQTSVEGANDTKYPTIPAGEYVAVIDHVDKPQARQGKDDKTFYPMEVHWKILDDKLEAEMDGRIPLVRQSIFLDITDAGSLDLGKGKNVQLGKLREALGQNNPGWAPNQLNGAGPAKIQITLAPDKNGVERNGVKAVGKMG